MPPPPCSTVPPRNHGRPAARAAASGVGVGDHEVVVEVGDAATPLGVEREREDADRERLEVVREVAADETGRVADVVAQQQPGRLESAGGDDDVPGPDLVRLPVAVEVAHAGGPPAGAVEHDLGDVRLRPDLAASRAQRPLERRDRVALRVDRAAVVAAEAAVVARRPPVVRHGVDAGGGRVRVQAPALGGGGGQDRAEHVGPRRHGVLAGAPGRERVGPGPPGRADEALGRRVVRFELVVLHGPVGDGGAVDRAAGGQEVEVLLAEAGELGVGVVAAAADGARQVVDLADEQPLAVGLVAPVACAVRATGRGRGSGGRRT